MVALLQVNTHYSSISENWSHRKQRYFFLSFLPWIWMEAVKRGRMLLFFYCFFLLTDLFSRLWFAHWDIGHTSHHCLARFSLFFSSPTRLCFPSLFLPPEIKTNTVWLMFHSNAFTMSCPFQGLQIFPPCAADDCYPNKCFRLFWLLWYSIALFDVSLHSFTLFCWIYASSSPSLLSFIPHCLSLFFSSPFFCRRAETRALMWMRS